MKVLHVASEYPPRQVHGLGRFVHGLARAQAAQGDEVHVLTNSHGGAQDDVQVDGVWLHRIASPNPPQPPDGHGEVLQWAHGAVARLLDRAGRFRDVDVIVAHDWLAALPAREAARALGRPLVATVHDEITGKRWGLLDADARFVRDLETLLVHDANLVLANSAYTADAVVRLYGVSRERVAVAHGGVDPAVVHVRHPELVADFRCALARPDELLVAYVGRLDAEKGLETLLDALPRVDAPARFVIAGQGRLAALVRARADARTRLLGYVQGEALAYLYRSADVVVVPSTYEPLGLVPLEAMLAGAAVVVSGAGGLVELVRDGRDGLVVPPGDAGALAHALTRLASDGDLRRRLACAGQARARAVFSWPAIATHTRRLYEGALRAPLRLCEQAPALPSRPLVSITIATYEAPAHVETALRSIFGRTRYSPIEAVVVDDGSGAAARARLRRAVAELRAAGHEVRLLEEPANRRFSAAQNRAIAAARGEYVCLFNDDAEVPPGSEGWLDGLVWLLEDRRAASVTPVTLYRDGTVYCAGAFGHGGHRDQHRPDGPDVAAAPRPTEWNNMACLLARRRFFAPDQAGPLDEGAEHAHYGSDREWGRAATARLGLTHWVHPVRIFHHSDEALRRPDASLQASASTRLPASIVLVAYQGLRFTSAALDAVFAHTPPPYELVLVCNGARDGTLQRFQALRDALGGRVAVQVLENDENLGYPVAANQGIRAARGRDVVLLNNDAMVRAGWLQALLAARAAYPRVGVVTAKVLNLDGTVQSAGGILHAPDGSFVVPHQGEDRLAPPVMTRRLVLNAGGPCMLVTRELLDELGVFDEAYSPGYFEDSDLCLRAREAGFALVYEPGAEVVHHAKATSSLVAREGKVDVWGRFRENERAFRARWGARLERDALAPLPSPRRRVLLCYHRSDRTTAAYCEAALRRAHDVVTAGHGQDLEPAFAADLVAAAAARLGAPIDLLLVVEGETFVPPCLDAAGCPTALWAIDTHLHATPQDDSLLRLAAAFDHVFVAQRDAVARFHGAGVQATWLPLACDPDVHRRHDLPRDLDVVFVGNLLPIHTRRRALLERLSARFRVTAVSGAWRDDMARLFSRAKVVWNCSLASDLNMRVFEALGTGSLLVTDRGPEGLTDLFHDGEHLALYDDATLEQIVARWLAAPNPERDEVAHRGKALVQRHHTYERRMAALLAGALGSPAPAIERIAVTVTTPYGCLGDRLCFLAAARELARRRPDLQVHTDVLPEVVARYEDGLLVAGTAGARVVSEPYHRHRVKGASPDRTYVGTYQAGLGLEVRGAPRPELPSLEPPRGLTPKGYLALQPLSGSAPNPPHVIEWLRSLVAAAREALPDLPIVALGRPEHVPRDLDGVDVTHLGDVEQLLRCVSHAAAVLTPRSAAAHAAAGYGVPAFVWVPQDGEDWHLDYPEWPSVRVPIATPPSVVARELVEFLDGVLPRVAGGAPDRARRQSFGDVWLWLRTERGGDEDVAREVISEDTYRLRALASDDVRLVVDVGAHVGSFTRFAKRLWPRARVVAVEPNPRSCELLRANVAALPEVEVEQAAVRYDGADVLTDSHGATGGGFLAHAADVGRLLAPNGRDRVWRTEPIGRVRVVRLEDLVDASERIDLLKLDCEGSELDILASASDELLARVGIVLGEFHDADGTARIEALLRRRLPHHEVELERDRSIGRFWCRPAAVGARA